ncbi:MAG: 3-beta hydroxysteroid dehydrogenase, partial [Verrucomicrobia bacterium]|nr:3-beta hydroxysteroid dehydrogenase [Verrucomicrobiota bacterium]
DLVTLQITHFDAWEGWMGNVAGGLDGSVSLQELTRLCEEVTGNSISIHSSLDQRPFDLRLFIGDCERLFKHTEWRPSRSLTTLVTDVADWVRCNQAALLGLS